MKTIRLSAALVILAALPLLAAAPRTAPPNPPPIVRQTLAQTEGAFLKGHMAGFGFTTQSAIAAATKIPATRISIVSRGLDTLRDAEFDSLTSVLWRTYRATADTTITARTRASYLRVFASTAPLPIATYPQRGVANGRLTTATSPSTYRLNALKHGYADRTRVVLRFTGAAPNVDQHIFYVRVPNVDEVWLYRDSLLSVPVVPTTFGLGGTIQQLP